MAQRPQRPKAEIVQVNLRLRESLRQLLVREAKKSNHSFNQEAVWRIEKSFTLEAELFEARLRIDELALAKTILEASKQNLYQAHELNIETKRIMQGPAPLGGLLGTKAGQ